MSDNLRNRNLRNRQKRINSLPNEVLAMILKKIKLKKRLPLRVLCARIKGVIEAIDAGQKSLFLSTFSKDILDYPRGFSSIRTLEQDRFLTHPNVEKDVITLKPIHFTDYFAGLMTRLFPNLQQLYFSLYV